MPEKPVTIDFRIREIVYNLTYKKNINRQTDSHQYDE